MTDQPNDTGHVHHVEGEDPQTAALRDAVTANRRILGIDGPGRSQLLADLAEADEYAAAVVPERVEADDGLVTRAVTHHVKGQNPTNQNQAGIEGNVRTVVIEDGVDSDLDLRVKILDARGIDPSFTDPVIHLSFLTGDDPGRIAVTASMLRRALAEVDTMTAPPPPPLDPPGGPVAAYRSAYLAKARDLGLDIGAMSPTRAQFDECIAAGLAAANAAIRPVAVMGQHDQTEWTGSAMVYDRGGWLDLKWVDRAAHVTITPEVLEGFVDQVNTLRAVVAEVRRRMPDSYASVEGGTAAWVRDLEQVAGPFAAELRVAAGIAFGDLGQLTVPIPPDSINHEHLFDAAVRLGGE